MPFDQQIRIKKLEEIKNNEEPVQTGFKINWKDEVRPFNAYKIPLEYLIYNKYNGRIGTLVNSWQKQYDSLNPENEDHAKIIAQFLWDSKKDRNDRTLNSLATEEQKIPGIVTRDGKIIDGNRRAMLLNIIKSKPEVYNAIEHGHAKYFIGIILDSDGTEKDLQRLETFYQMGQDEKVDYNPIEKYLKVKTLEQNDFDKDTIANLMNEPTTKIIEWSETMNYMDKYLSYLGYDGVYTMLEKREDQFLTLRKSLKLWKTGRGIADWNPNKMNQGLLEIISYDYIRAKTEGKEFRIIGLRSRNGIFSNKQVWEKFKKRHLDKINNITRLEPSPDMVRENSPSATLTHVYNARDFNWIEKTNSFRKEFLGKAKNELDNIKDSEQPQLLLEKALDSLEKINVDNPNFSEENSELIELLKKINKKSYEFKRRLGG